MTFGWPIAVAAVAAGAAACSSGPASPYFGDERFLVLGVSPEEEANAVSKELAVEGRTEYLRLRGSAFTALGFAEPDGTRAWVRVVTQRGIELALDPTASHALSRGERYELVAPATEGLYDADGDGFDEVIVQKRSYDADDPCVLAYRLQNTGVVELIEDEAHTRAAARDVIGELEPCLSAPAPSDEQTETPDEPAAPAQ